MAPMAGVTLQQGVCVVPPLTGGFVTSDVSKHHFPFFFFFLLFQKQTKKGNFLTCGQLRKEKLPTREHWGRWPQGEAPAAREDPSAVSLLHTGGTVVPGDMGPVLLLLLTAAGIGHGRSTGFLKPYNVSTSLQGRFGMW